MDTGPLAAYLQGRAAAIALISPWIQRREVATSVISYAEVNEYIKGFPDYPRRHRELRRLMQEIHPLTMTYPALERYGDLRRGLRPPHGPGLIGDLDTLIAATALVRDPMLVTTDTHFQRVPDLGLYLLPSLRQPLMPIGGRAVRSLSARAGRRLPRCYNSAGDVVSG